MGRGYAACIECAYGGKIFQVTAVLRMRRIALIGLGLGLVLQLASLVDESQQPYTKSTDGPTYFTGQPLTPPTAP